MEDVLASSPEQAVNITYWPRQYNQRQEANSYRGNPTSYHQSKPLEVLVLCQNKLFSLLISMVIVLISGVSGSGKTTIGKALSKKLSCPFVDADDFHCKANVRKMSQGIPLTDEDRHPWLLALHKVIERWCDRCETGVLSCSALKEPYRQTILHGKPTRSSGIEHKVCEKATKKLRSSYRPSQKCLVVVLQGSKDLIRERMRLRQNHFMPDTLLDSQFDLLEVPVDGDDYSAVCLSIDQSVEEVTNEILRTLRAKFGVRVSIQSTV